MDGLEGPGGDPGTKILKVGARRDDTSQKRGKDIA